jgi:hypothetical protein
VNEDIRGRCIDGRDKSQVPRARITVLDTDRKKGYEESSERAVCDAQLQLEQPAILLIEELVMRAYPNLYLAPIDVVFEHRICQSITHRQIHYLPTFHLLDPPDSRPENHLLYHGCDSCMNESIHRVLEAGSKLGFNVTHLIFLQYSAIISFCAISERRIGRSTGECGKQHTYR